MSGLIEFTHYQSEALLICLAASLAWAGVLLLGARGLERTGSMTSTEKLWTAALLFAVLPSVVAPSLAALGVSIRPAPASVALDAIEFVSEKSVSLKEAPLVAGPVLLTTEQLIGAGALIYVYGVIMTFFLWAARQAGLSYAVSRAKRVTDAQLLHRIEGWANRLGVKMPTIKQSHHVSSVCITGLARQTVLIPCEIGLRVSSDDLVLMCAHELAHVRRGDTRLFTAAQLARVLFWFNPLVSRIASHAELAAEESADALVLAKGIDRRAYAACFVEGLKFAAYKMNVQPAFAPSFTPPDRHGRRRRLNSILSPKPACKTPLGARLIASAAASTVALAAFGQAALAVDPDSAGERRALLQNLPLVGDITLGYGEKINGALGDNRPQHEELDIKAPKGAKILAPGDGVVVEATNLYNNMPAWGKVVVIDHGNGLVTQYAHLDSYAVRKGDRVEAGAVIANVGATSKTSGPHLHFETLRDGKSVDPVDVVASIQNAPESNAVEDLPDSFEGDAPAAVAPAEPSAALPAAPESAAAPTATPAPIAPPRATVRRSNSIAPAPVVRGVPGDRAFAPSEKNSEFRFSEPVLAGEKLATPENLFFRERQGFSFDGHNFGMALMAEDTEKQLLGALNGDGSASYNLSFRNGDEVYNFSSDEPMTSEKWAQLRQALKSLRKEAEKAQTSRREALEMQRDALMESLDDLDDEGSLDIEGALSDLEDAEADLDDQELTREEIAAARATIREQRRQMERNSEVHKRAIEMARRQIEAQITQIEQKLEAFEDAGVDD